MATPRSAIAGLPRAASRPAAERRPRPAVASASRRTAVPAASRRMSPAIVSRSIQPVRRVGVPLTDTPQQGIGTAVTGRPLPNGKTVMKTVSPRRAPRDLSDVADRFRSRDGTTFAKASDAAAADRAARPRRAEVAAVRAGAAAANDRRHFPNAPGANDAGDLRPRRASFPPRAHRGHGKTQLRPGK